ncbi:peptidase M16 [Endomicrobiia bacterium]|nr:peptidase M16 [Endomicrobiia bacterium]
MSFFIITGACGCKSNNQATTTGTQDVYAGLGKATDPIPLVPKARIGTLPNGLKYYILKNNNPKGKAYLTLVVNAGSVAEKEDEQGFSHFVEQIAFKSTKKYLQDNSLLPATKDPLDSSNSSTGFDETIYNFEVPIQTDKNNVKHIPQKAMDIFDNLTHTVTFSQKDIDDLKGIILEEKRLLEEKSEGLAMQKVDSILAKGSSYANRYPKVIQEVTKAVTPSKLKEFYSRWYRTDNMALVFVGDFDDAMLEASLVTHFHAPSSNTPLERPVYNLPLPKKGNVDVEILAYPNQDTIKTCLYYKRQQKVVSNDLATCRQYFLDRLIKCMISKRFDEISSKQSTPYEHLHFGHITDANLLRYYTFGVQIKKDNSLEESIKAILEEKERISRYGWTNSEVEIAKRSVMLRFEEDISKYSDKSSSDFAYDFSKHFLAREGVIADDQWKLSAAKKMFSAITTKDLTDATKDYFLSDDLTIVVLASSKDKLLSKEKIKEAVKDVKKSKIVPPAPVIDGKLLSRTPTHGTILKETIDKETGAVILELSNGAKVILKNTPNKDSSSSGIVLRALAKGGTMAVTNKDDIPAARFASEILDRSHVGQFFDKLNDYKLKKKVDDFRTYIEPFERCIEGDIWSYKDPEPLFELIYLRFTCHEIEPDKIKGYLESRIHLDREFMYENILCDNNPNFSVHGSNNQSRFNSDPFEDWYLYGYAKYFEVNDYPKITQERTLKFLKKCFNPADFTFVFVGKIDIETFKTYIKNYIASIPRSETLVNQKFLRPKPSKQEIYKEDYKNWSYVNMYWIIDQKYSPKLKATSKIFEQYINALLDNAHDNNHSDDDHTGNNNGCEIYLNPFFDELYANVWHNWHDSVRPNEYISKIFKHMQNIAQGNIDTGILVKAKKAAVDLYCGNSDNNDLISKDYACSAVWNNAPLSESQHFPFVCETISKKDLKDMAGRLLKGKYYQRIVYPKKPQTAK